MIDFRYHLVSLISVFLALAVGIALGAGPLKETIGDTLTGQVDQLREEKDALRTQLDTSTSETSAAEQYIAAAAPELLDGTLTDRNVAVVGLGAVDADIRAAVEDQLTESGAKVTAQVTLTAAWSSTDLRTFRQALSTSLTDYLDPKPESGATADTVIAEALVQGLTGADSADPTTLDSDASTLVQLLSTGDDPLITLEGSVSAPADAVVLLTTDVTEPTTATTADEDEGQAALDSYTVLAQVAAIRAEGSVVAGGAVADDGLIAQILADDSTADQVSTVNGVGSIAGQVSVPLALNADIGGKVGHYGSGDGLTVLPATTDLGPVDRTPQSAADTAGADEGAQAEATADAGAQG